MRDPEKRRINPISHLTFAAVVLLLFFQVLTFIGALELKAGTVAAYAPWAYEPFLRLVGEHPDSQPRWAAVEEEEAESESIPEIVGVTGLESSVIPVLIETNDVSSAADTEADPVAPAEVETEPAGQTAPTNQPTTEKLDVLPVG